MTQRAAYFVLSANAAMLRQTLHPRKHANVCFRAKDRRRHAIPPQHPSYKTRSIPTSVRCPDRLYRYNLPPLSASEALSQRCKAGPNTSLIVSRPWVRLSAVESRVWPAKSGYGEPASRCSRGPPSPPRLSRGPPRRGAQNPGASPLCRNDSLPTQRTHSHL